MYRLVLALCLAGVALAGKSAKCPWAMGKYPFDDHKFVGDWYLVAGVPIAGDKVAQCGKFSYKINGEKEQGYSLSYKALDMERKTVMMDNIAYPIFGGKPESGGTLMGVWKKDGSDKWSSVYKQSITVTDYNNYAVLVACKQTFDEKTKTFGRHLFAEILSRKPTLSHETLDVLKNLVAGYDIDMAKIQAVDHSNCTY